MTGSLFNNYLVTNLEMSQSIAEGIFLSRHTGIPQDNKIITAQSASYFAQLSNIGIPNTMCPTWNQIYVARVGLVTLTINLSAQYTGSVWHLIASTDGTALNTTIAVSGKYYYYYGGTLHTNQPFTITVSSGDTTNYTVVTSNPTYAYMTSISPDSSTSQKYLMGDALYIS